MITITPEVENLVRISFPEGVRSENRVLLLLRDVVSRVNNLSEVPPVPVEVPYDTIDTSTLSTHTWNTVSVYGRAGVIKSPTISNSQNSGDIRFLFDSAKTGGTLSFDVLTSSEETYDRVQIRTYDTSGNTVPVVVDGSPTSLIERSGVDTEWETITVGLTAGTKEVRFRYIKDNSGSSGDDAFYVDPNSFVYTA